MQCSQKGRRFWSHFAGVYTLSQSLGSSPGAEGSPEGCIHTKSGTALKADWLRHSGQGLSCTVPCVPIWGWMAGRHNGCCSVTWDSNVCVTSLVDPHAGKSSLRFAPLFGHRKAGMQLAKSKSSFQSRSSQIWCGPSLISNSNCGRLDCAGACLSPYCTSTLWWNANLSPCTQSRYQSRGRHVLPHAPARAKDKR